VVGLVALVVAARLAAAVVVVITLGAHLAPEVREQPEQRVALAALAAES
jgi:hypothetical protein